MVDDAAGAGALRPMSVNPLEEMGGEAEARSLTSATYRRLKKDVLACTLQPGQRLKISDLAAQYGCSPGAVREALTRLVAEELVVSEDQRGFRVAPVSRSDLLDLTQTRIDIETAALRHAIAKGGLDWQAGIVSTIFRLSNEPVLDDSGAPNPRWSKLHQDFHMALVAGCNSPRLMRLCLAYFHQSQRFRVLTIRYHERGRSADAEHRELADAVIGRDAERAVRLLADHYNRTTNLIIDVDRDGDLSMLTAT